MVFLDTFEFASGTASRNSVFEQFVAEPKSIQKLDDSGTDIL
jgi:hypothetical protein